MRHLTGSLVSQRAWWTRSWREQLLWRWAVSLLRQGPQRREKHRPRATACPGRVRSSIVRLASLVCSEQKCALCHHLPFMQVASDAWKKTLDAVAPAVVVLKVTQTRCAGALGHAVLALQCMHVAAVRCLAALLSELAARDGHSPLIHSSCLATGLHAGRPA